MGEKRRPGGPRQDTGAGRAAPPAAGPAAAAAGGARPSRREFLALGAGAFVVAALPFAALRGRQLVRRTVPAMGTIAELAVVHRDARYAHRALDAAVAEIEAVERRLTRFRGDSEIGIANREAWARAVPVSAGTAAVLRESLRWAAASDGRFDPCLGNECVLWNFGSRRTPPAPHQLQRRAGLHPWRALEVDRAGGSAVVVFRQRDMALDLGGIGKGYGVDRAAQVLREWGITSAFVNLGGDLYALGRNADGEPWRVGVRDPLDPTRLSATLDVEDRAVATSGTYEHYFDHDGRRYHHLLDPLTAAPRVTAQASLTVLADTGMVADAAATAAFGLDRADAQSLIRRVAADAHIAGV
jgi:FAD:protein FMN transferase